MVNSRARGVSWSLAIDGLRPRSWFGCAVEGLCLESRHILVGLVLYAALESDLGAIKMALQTPT